MYTLVGLQGLEPIPASGPWTSHQQTKLAEELTYRNKLYTITFTFEVSLESLVLLSLNA